MRIYAARQTKARRRNIEQSHAFANRLINRHASPTKQPATKQPKTQ